MLNCASQSEGPREVSQQCTSTGTLRLSEAEKVSCVGKATSLHAQENMKARWRGEANKNATSDFVFRCMIGPCAHSKSTSAHLCPLMTEDLHPWVFDRVCRSTFGVLTDILKLGCSWTDTNMFLDVRCLWLQKQLLSTSV